MAILIRSSLPVLLASLLIVSITIVAETTPQSISDPYPLNMDPSALETLIREVRVSGPFVFDLQSTPYRREGSLTACGYRYSVFLMDFSTLPKRKSQLYRRQPVIVSGSVLYNMRQDQALYVSLKVSLTDIEEIDGRLWQTDAPVNYAYLRYGSHSTAGTEDSNIEGDEGSRLFGYIDREEGSEMLQWVVLGPVTIALNRQPNGFDLEVDLSVMDFPEVQLDIAACVREMANQ